jgi:hypothetical protein
MTPEGKVKAMVKRCMETAFPGCYRFMPVQNGMGAPALDFYYCVDGLFVGIETKAPGTGKKQPEPTPRQQSTMDEIKAAGGLCYLVYDGVTMGQTISDIMLQTVSLHGR